MLGVQLRLRARQVPTQQHSRDDSGRCQDAGTELTPALGIGSFAEKTLVHEGQCTKVDPGEDKSTKLLTRVSFCRCALSASFNIAPLAGAAITKCIKTP